MKKNKTKLSTAILIGSAVIGSTNCEAQVEKDSLELANNPNKENQLEKKFPIIKKDSIELEIRLRELAETEYKGELSFGAMCYEIEKHIDGDYICSICGKKTKRSGFHILNEKRISRIVKEIKALGYDVILDNKEFCQYCSKDLKDKRVAINQSTNETLYDYSSEFIEEPELIFKIRYSKESNYYIVRSNIESDYLILLEYLRGKEKYDAGMVGELPLHIEINVLKKMTGLGKDIITHKHYGFDHVNKEEYIEYLKEQKYTDEEIEKRIKEEDEYNERR